MKNKRVRDRERDERSSEKESVRGVEERERREGGRKRGRP